VYRGFIDNTLQFDYINRNLNITEKLAVGMGFYHSYEHFNQFTNGGQNSGDYIFRPKTGQFEALTYSKVVKATITEGYDNESEMVFYFQQEDKSQKAMIHVTLDKDTNTIKTLVDMDSIPYSGYYGYEVVAKFKILNFKNNGTFYTDSNALEMQERILNYRPTWNITDTNLNQSNENVTANYFPINSAISMNDGNSRRFTVTNDRSQAGSALQDGLIEFMQNRRIPTDDSRGMGEALNEVDANGNGIRVKATYYIDISYPLLEGGAPKQRLIQ